MIDGSAGVGGAFGLTGAALGFSAGTAGLVSCAKEAGASNKTSAPSAMNLRKSMETIGETEKSCVYLAEPTCNASNGADGLWKGPKPTAPTNLKSKRMFPDLIRNLAVILLKPGHDSLRLSEVAPVRV